MYFIEQTDEQDFIKIKNFCSSFYTVWRMKRQIVDWEKIFVMSQIKEANFQNGLFA